MPPDEEMVDLIETAFLEGQIDGVKADLAYWLVPENGFVTNLSHGVLKTRQN